MQIKTYLNTYRYVFFIFIWGMHRSECSLDGAADKILSQVSLHTSLRYIYGDIKPVSERRFRQKYAYFTNFFIYAYPEHVDIELTLQ